MDVMCLDIMYVVTLPSKMWVGIKIIIQIMSVCDLRSNFASLSVT